MWYYELYWGIIAIFEFEAPTPLAADIEVSAVFRLIHTGLFRNLKHTSPSHHGLFACMWQIFMSLVFKQLGFVWSMMSSIRQRCGYLICILNSRSVMSAWIMIILWYQRLRIFLNKLLKYFILVWWICWGDFLNDYFCIYFSFESICMAWSRYILRRIYKMDCWFLWLNLSCFLCLKRSIDWNGVAFIFCETRTSIW